MLYPISFFKSTINEIQYNKFLDLTNISLATRLSKIDFDDYKKYIEDREAEFLKTTKNDKIPPKEINGDDVFNEMMNLQKELKGK